MKLKRVLSVLLVLCFVLASVFSSGASASGGALYAGEPIRVFSDEKTSVAIASTYLFGEEFFAPALRFPFGGKEYDAKAYIRFPSGKISDKSTIVLNEAGKYEVTYLAQCEKKTLSETYSFSVTQELYSVTDPNSKVYYGTHEYIPGTNGIIASIRPGDSFVYNKPIDISSFTRNNKILTLNVLPQTIGTVDAQKIIIRLTDIYDPENFITIEMKKVDENKLAWAENSTYVVAYGNGQDSCGLEEGSHLNTGRVIDYNGKKYTIHKNNIYGAWTDYSMPGAPRYQNINLPYYEPQYVGEQEFSIAMDYAKGVVYAGPELSLVNDLRSDVVYGSNFWNGFTTGEVFVSISATGYKADALNLIIKEIAGQSTDDLTENLYKDAEAPSLDIQWEGEYPIGLVGHKYPVFPVYSYDAYDREEKEVSVSVCLNAGLQNEVSVPVIDGCFVPQFCTRYYIRYETTDLAGNKNEKTIEVNVSDSIPQLAVDSMTDAVNVSDVGSVVRVKELTYKNAVGSVNETVTAVLKTDPDISYEIADGSFIPLYAGEYEIRYEFRDYLFDGNYSYSISVNPTDKPLIDAEITLLRYYIKGCEYTLPEYTGYVFKDGKPVSVPLDIYVMEGSKKVAVTDNKYVPGYDGDITVVYSVTNGSETVKKEIAAKSVDVGYDSSLCMEKYFAGSNFIAIPESKSIEYQFTKNGTVTLDFINELASSNFAIRFGASEGKDNFSKIHLYLTDAYDESIRIRFTYEKESSGYVKFYVNDHAASNFKSYFASNDDPIILEYNNRLKQVSPYPASYQLISDTVYGEAFTGFVSDRIYLSIEAEGISGESALRITNLCGQPFTKIKADIIEPKVYVVNDVGDYDINSIYTLGSACIADVLDPNIKAFVRVKDPKGQTVTSLEGVLLDETAPYNVEHHFELKEYGVYQVNYETIDTGGNQATYTFVINVVDKEAPSVTILNPVKEGKTGEPIPLAKIGITDNCSEKFDLYVCLIAPTGVSCSLTKTEGDTTIINKSFTVSAAGLYRIYYYVSDEAGNVTPVSYPVEVR